MRTSSTIPRPLDQAAAERLALRYVERFATSRGRLAAYLDRKLRERGCVDGATIDTQALADAMADRGYVDDRAWAQARASAMARRGLGGRRVVDALRHAAIPPEAIAEAVAGTPALESALALARRRRIGPFADRIAERAERERQIAALVRGGHGLALARRIATMPPGAEIDPHEFEDPGR